MSRAQVFWLSEAARQPLGPTHHSIQWVLGTFSTGINLSGHTADHWLLSKAKNTWSFASTPLYLHGVHKVICTLYLYVIFIVLRLQEKVPWMLGMTVLNSCYWCITWQPLWFISSSRNCWSVVKVLLWLLLPTFVCTQYLDQCFSTAGPWPSTGPWHQLYQAARRSPGICHFIFLSIFHE